MFKLQTPMTCCVFTGKGVDDFSCAINPQERTSNYLKVCSPLIHRLSEEMLL